jgi:hypothetical protein
MLTDLDALPGAMVTTVASIEQLNDHIRTLSEEHRKLYWRGQAVTWSLLSSVDRVLHNAGVNAVDRPTVLAKHLGVFRDSIARHYPTIPLGDDDSTWAFAQHYGVLTPLLDWTTSPDVALYFAFLEIAPTDSDGYRYLYVLDPTLRRLLAPPNDDGAKDRFVQPVECHRLPYTTPRAERQHSVFTKALNGDSIEQNIERWYSKRPMDTPLNIFRIPEALREACLETLAARSVTHMTLLLDIHSLANECNRRLTEK